MKTKREVLEQFAKCGNCEGIKCTDCPYYEHSKYCLYIDDLRKIGAMAILRQNRKKRKFDPSKILTCVTADKAKVGMKGYFGITIRHIKDNIEKGKIDVLSNVEDNTEYLSPFKREDAEHFPLFYPIEEVEE